MNEVADEGVVCANIAAQPKVQREAQHDGLITRWFSIERSEKKYFFHIPAAPSSSGMYSQAHLEAIELELNRFGLDLLPLDHNLG